jgi:HAD superfamily hydrolase (TIGR01549 family)
MAKRAAVLFDVDGTLVDNNYLHIVAWWRAFRDLGRDVAMCQIHRCVGMGADQLVPELLGEPNDAAAEGHSRHYQPFLRELRAFAGATALLRESAALGLDVVLATSAEPAEVEAALQALDASEWIAAITNIGDVERSKPHPDLFEAAMGKVGVSADRCVAVGDTVYDVVAAAKLGVRCVALTSGGICESELREAGAAAIYRDTEDLRRNLRTSPIGELAGDGER